MKSKGRRPSSESAAPAARAGESPADDEAVEDLEFDDPKIDEAELPQLDTDDSEAIGHDAGYDDLLDRGWLESRAEDAGEEERTDVEDIGLTIELADTDTDEEGAQVFDLDVGSLLTALPSEGTELDLEPGLTPERGELGLGLLRDVLLPDADDAWHDDREVGDDERFPAFDDASDIAPRSRRDDDRELDIEPDDISHNEELT